MIVMKTDLIEQAYLLSKVTDKNGYPYAVNPITDGTPEITKELLEQITDDLIEVCDLNCDLILAPEAMAIPYATLLTYKTGIPYQIIRKRKYGLPGEIEFTKSTGYAKSEMFLNNVKPGTRAIIIDDIISTGGSLLAIIQNLRNNGIEVTEAAMVLDKSNDLAKLEKEVGIPIRTLVRVGVDGKKPIIC